MAHFEVMLVQGIRSFGPYAEDAGQIKFFRPLTLIMGQNGCGKTTLIESLKYVCTGEMPPGTGRGQSFVHDPNMAGDMSVKAQVKLKFCNVTGQRMVAQRVIEASQKVRQLSVKTLDSTLTRHTSTGQLVIVNKKCVDMDAELMAALGVTKPILNYVIFCHQEDSNWPLDEGKKLKERFDAIFDATEYLNCIKKMKEKCKSLRAEETVKKGEATAAQKDFAEAERLRDEIGAEETSLAASERRALECRQEREQLQQRLQQIGELERRAGHWQQQQQLAQSRLEQTRDTHRQLQTSLAADAPHLLELDEQQLQQLLTEATSCSEDRHSALQRDLAQLEQLKSRLQSCADRENKLSVERGKLEAELEQQRQMRRERDTLLRRIAGDSGAPSDTDHQQLISQLPASGPLSARHVQLVSELVAGRVQLAEAGCERVRSEAAAGVRLAQERVDTARCRLTEHRSHLDTSQRRLTAVHTERGDKQQLLAEARSSGDRIGRLNSQLRQLQLQQEQLQQLDGDADAISARISEHERSLAKLEATERQLQSEKDSVLSCLALRKQLQFNQSALHQQRSSIAELIRRNDANFVTIDVTADVQQLDGLTETLKLRCQQLQVALNRKEAECRRAQKQRSAAELTAHQAAHQLGVLERQLQEEQQQLTEALRDGASETEDEGERSDGGADLDAQLSRAEQLVGEQEERRGKLLASRQLFTDYIKQLQVGGEGARSSRPAAKANQSPACPLCRRCFTSKAAAATLSADLSQQLQQLPEQLAEAEQLRDRLRRRCDQLLALRPVQQRVQRLLSGELVAARAAAASAEQERAAAVAAEERLQEELAERQRVSRCGDLLRSEVAARLEEQRVECDRLQAECDRVKRQLPPSLSAADRSVEAIDADLTATRDKITATRQTVQQLRERGAQLRSLAEQLLELRGQRLQLQQLAADEQQLVTRCDELSDEATALQAAIGRLKQQIAEADTAVSRELSERDEVNAGWRRREEEARRQADSARDASRQLQQAEQQLMSATSSDTAGQLAELSEQLRQLQQLQSEERAREETTRQLVERGQEEKRCQQLRLRQLQDYQQLLARHQQLQQLESEVQSAAEQLDQLQLPAVAKERRQLEQRAERLAQSIFGEEGGQRRMRGVLAERRAKLDLPQFRDAPAVYRRRNIEHVLWRMAERDLATYARALDDALIGFHTERMRQINGIVRELWRDCYGGNDIDHIRICTDVCGGDSGGGAGGAARRTTYNYRVVMSKNGVEMDMRGRCSAGQKVLASLIIRMALAETFGTSCGMLTLDEPTTNLDDENVARLADALAAIVAKRAVQANFQMVVITHDRGFVDVLSHSEHLDAYYEVVRTDRGLSRLLKRDTR